jgi:hypothetical protein
MNKSWRGPILCGFSQTVAIPNFESPGILTGTSSPRVAGSCYRGISFTAGGLHLTDKNYGVPYFSQPLQEVGLFLSGGASLHPETTSKS